MDRARFYAHLRSAKSKAFGKSLSKGQVDGLERTLDEAQKRGVNIFQLAYILATAYLESGRTMQPVREFGGEKYLRSKPYYPWVGEGLVQVTWEVNHRKFGATKPGQLMEWPIALRALFDGMLQGMFTGKRLSDYIDPPHVDYVGARRIVNGTDRAHQIAEYAMSFETALREAGYLGQAPKPKPAIPLDPDGNPPSREAPPKPKPVPVAKRGFLSGVVDVLLVLFRGWR